MTLHTDRRTTVSDRRTDGGFDDLDVPQSDGSDPRVAIRRVLENGRRRAVVRCLLAEDDPLEVSTLVARITDAEQDPAAVTPLLDRRQRVHVSLCRTHLPLLENHRIVSYDRRNGRVEPGRELQAFGSILENYPDG